MSSIVGSIGRRVIEIVADEFGRDPSEISRRTAFIGDLGADTVDMAELITVFRDELRVKIPSEKANTIATVGEAIDCITELLVKTENRHPHPNRED